MGESHTGIIDLKPLLAAGGRLRAGESEVRAPMASPLSVSSSSPPEGIAISLVPRAFSKQKRPVQVGAVVGGGAMVAILLGLGIGALLRPSANELPKTERVVLAAPPPAMPLPAAAPVAAVEPATPQEQEPPRPVKNGKKAKMSAGTAFKSQAPRVKPVDRCGCGNNLQCAIRCAQK